MEEGSEETKSSKNLVKKLKGMKKPSIALFKNLARTFRIYWEISPISILFFVFVILGIALLPFLNSYLYGQLFNLIVDFLSDKNVQREDIFFLFVYIYASALALNILYSLSNNFQRYIWITWDEKISMMLSRKISELDLEVLEDSKFNVLRNKVRDGASYKPANFAYTTLWIINDFIQIIASILILITLTPLVLPLIFLSLVPEFIVLLRSSKLAWSIWDAKGEVKKKYWETKSTLENTEEIKEVRIFGSRSYLLNMVQSLMSDFTVEQKKIIKSQSSWSLGTNFFENLVGAGIEFWMLLKVLAKNGFSVGSYTFYLRTINSFSAASRNLLRNVCQLYDNSLYMTDLFKLLDMENKIVDKPDATVISTEKVPFIEFKNVSFSYPGSEKKVFDNLSLKIQSGEDIAIVGENGAGKTTFVKLLARFYDVTDGQILVNGIDLRDVNLESWRQNLGILFQDFNRYRFTVKENILLGNVNKEESMEEIKRVAADASADVFIEELPHKYDQMLGKWYDEGEELSGGQWQRVALARAFYRDANILILDEPTSAMDAKAEYDIFQKIARVQKEKTTIIISHRFSTVRNADKIYVIDKGKIMEQGSHTELMKLEKGKYKEMFELQAEGYK